MTDDIGQRIADRSSTRHMMNLLKKTLKGSILGSCPRMQDMLFLTNRLSRAGESRPYRDNGNLRGIRDYSDPVYFDQGRGGEVPSPASFGCLLGQAPGLQAPGQTKGVGR